MIVNLSTYGQVISSEYTKNEDFQGNVTVTVSTPSSTITLPSIQSFNPAGFISLPVVGTPVSIQDSLAMSYLDKRNIFGIDELIEGESAIFSNDFLLTCKNGSVKYYQNENKFSQTAVLGENLTKVLDSLFGQIKELSAKLEALQTDYYNHTHTESTGGVTSTIVATSIKDTNPSGSTYTNNGIYTAFTDGESNLDNGEILATSTAKEL